MWSNVWSFSSSELTLCRKLIPAMTKQAELHPGCIFDVRFYSCKVQNTHPPPPFFFHPTLGKQNPHPPYPTTIHPQLILPIRHQLLAGCTPWTPSSALLGLANHWCSPATATTTCPHSHCWDCPIWDSWLGFLLTARKQLRVQGGGGWRRRWNKTSGIRNEGMSVMCIVFTLWESRRQNGIMIEKWSMMMHVIQTLISATTTNAIMAHYGVLSGNSFWLEKHWMEDSMLIAVCA